MGNSRKTPIRDDKEGRQLDGINLESFSVCYQL